MPALSFVSHSVNEQHVEMEQEVRRLSKKLGAGFGAVVRLDRLGRNHDLACLLDDLLGDAVDPLEKKALGIAPFEALLGLDRKSVV